MWVQKKSEKERERENVGRKAYFMLPNFNYDLTVGLSGLRISAQSVT